MSTHQESPNVIILIADCLRQASATRRNLPFITSNSDLQFTRCYSPSTWTLPSHVSLFTGTTPNHHQVTRRTKYSEQGDTIDPAQVSLPTKAKQNGYTTALFSENPHFSRRVGFDQNVDFVDDWINFKRWASNFSAVNYISPTSPSLREIPTVVKKIAGSNRPVTNLGNTVFGAWQYASDSEPKFPHQGMRILDHLELYVSSTDGPKLVTANLMDTHNPHYSPPERGVEALNESFDAEQLESLVAASDNRFYMFTEDQRLPTDARDGFSSWEDVFRMRRSVYNTQIRYFDHLVKAWANTVSNSVLDNSLVIVTGDHGQLFGEEGRAGHHTSLHPHGVNVPLFVSLPARWASQKEKVDDVTSWIDLTRTVEDVMCGDIASGDEFVKRITENGEAIVTVDGSGYDLVGLKADDRFETDLVDQILATRKIGVIRDEHMIVYESKWESTELSKTEFELSSGQRTIRDISESTPGKEISLSAQNWLTQRKKSKAFQRQVNGPIAERLESLGYK